jgi:hypothetical protein
MKRKAEEGGWERWKGGLAGESGGESRARAEQDTSVVGWKRLGRPAPLSEA